MNEFSEHIDKLAPALVKAQAEMPAIPMDGRNPFFKSKYATLGSVIETVKPVLERNGLAVTQMTVSQDEGRSVGVKTMLLHESGQWISSTATVRLGFEKNVPQEAGAVISYLRRYALSSILGVYADEDIDANSTQQQAPTQTPIQTPKSAPRQPTQAQKETSERPYTPTQLIERLKEIATKLEPATKAEIGFLAGGLAQLVGTENRNKFQEFLFGEPSLSKADAKLVSAGIKWLDLVYENKEYIVNETSLIELQSAYKMMVGKDKMDDLLNEKSVD